MSDTTFTDGVTLTAADWFNDVNRLHYTIFGDPATLAAARVALLGGTGSVGQTFRSSGTDGAWADGWTFSSPVASTSGTAVEFTSLPTGLNEIVMFLAGVSTSGTSIPIIQLGDSGGFEGSGYSGAAANFSEVPGITIQDNASMQGWSLAGSHASSVVMTGFITMKKYANNDWAYSSSLGSENGPTIMGGFKTVSATVDRVRLVTEGGSDTFDAGAVLVAYRR